MTLSIYVAILSSIVLLSRNLNKGNIKALFLKTSIPFILIYYFLFWVNTSKIVMMQDLWHIVLVGVVSMYTHPILMFIANKGSKNKIFCLNDVVAGLYASFFFDDFTGCYRSTVRKQPLIYCNKFYCYSCDYFPSFFLIGYYAMFGKLIDFSTIQTVLYTNKNEIKEWLRSLGFMYKFNVCCTLMAIMVICSYILSSIYHNYVLSNSETFICVMVCAMILFVLVGTRRRKGLLFKTNLGDLIIKFIEYQQNLQKYNSNREKKIESLKLKSEIKSSFGTVIVVIGESANRMHMQAFANNYRDTTPWLSEQSGNDNFFLYQNSYACYVQTALVIPLALTNSNQFNKISFDNAISIMDVAKAVGFKTYWFSNQNMLGIHDTPSSVIGNGADVHRWVLEDYSTPQYDEKLLDYLYSTVNEEGNKFIVLHLKGSHEDYNCRYPKNFEKWPVAKGDYLGDNPYDNSILYTDFILKSIYEFAVKNLNLQAMVYFSDHGVEIGRKRMPNFTGFEDVRIPVFTYLSDEYKGLFPETAKSLRMNEDKYFVNDLIFNFIVGLLQIKSDLFPETDNLCSERYEHDKNTLFTDLGKVRLSEDVDNA